ncbi:glycosyltransferase family 2 protein [Frisingicoccus sp.]|uniref:glycosyltransferase family 2 protein n=1 Tax=Frisingicoccus sp. TaxID=1918627 RepID=UPI003AB5F677
MNNSFEKTVVVAMTCFNRADKTVNCIESLVNGNPAIDFSFVVVDDNSSDDTVDRLKMLSKGINIHIIETQGNLYYSRGMKKALDYILESNLKAEKDYLLLVNDDVDFYRNAIESLIQQSNEGIVVVGATCDSSGKQSYGAVKYLKKGALSTRKVCTGETIQADTFNANCVLIPIEAFICIGSFDEHYIHCLGDYDYGFKFSRSGYIIQSSKDYVGICDNNSIEGTWIDSSLGVVERLKLKETPKGLPTKIWWYYVNKHFGIVAAIEHSISPFIRIIFRK